jgi:hypothetical protein
MYVKCNNLLDKFEGEHPADVHLVDADEDILKIVFCALYSFSYDVVFSHWVFPSIGFNEAV